MIKNVIILGDHIQSLGVSRIAHSLGYRVLLFNDDNICLSRFSKSCGKFTKFRDEDELLQMLLIYGNRKKDSIIMPTNDRLIHFVSKNYLLLKENFTLSLPAPDIIKKCYNKRETYQTAERLEIPIPKSFFPKDKKRLVEFIDELCFPVIIKPAVVTTFSKSTGKKVFLCRNEKELLKGYDSALEIIPPDEIIVQEVIKGGAQNLYSYCSFIADEEIYGSFVANRIRQKPMDFGFSTTFAISVVNKEIEQLAVKFLRGINYFGLSEVEMMYDPKDTNYKLIEINPRTWKWHSIANKLNINLIEMLIDYCNKNRIRKKQNTINGVGWIECVTDTYVVLGEILKGKMDIKNYLQTIRIEKEFACFSRKDLLPGLFYLLFLPYLFLNR